MPDNEDIIDGVHRYPSTGIKVLVVGSGPGGLFAALEAWRKGNEVEILEQSASFSPSGDFFTITPSPLSVFKYYPSLQLEWEKKANDAPVKFMMADARLIKEFEPEWKLCKNGTAAGETKTSLLNSRMELQDMIKAQCDRVGIRLLFDQKVVEYGEHADYATVITAGGDRYTADIIVAADGIGTKSQHPVTGGRSKFQSSGYAIARCGFPISAINPNSKAAHLLPRPGERPAFNVYLSSTGHLIMFFTPDFVGFSFTHADDAGTARESWSPKTSAKDIVERYFKDEDNWDARVLDFARQIPVPLVDGCLTWRDPQKKWTSDGGRIVQVGDAAHPFLPTSGNGATQALEDGISLAECLRLGGKAGAHVSTKVHNLLRYQRVSTIQRTAFANHGGLETFDVKDLTVFKNPMTWGKWNWGHKPEDYTRDRYTEALEHVQCGTEAEFQSTNLPPGYQWEDWSMESELERLHAGGGLDTLKSNGYWGYE